MMATNRISNERSIDGDGRVTGGITFVNDVRCADALHAAFTLSTYEHAKIRVDVSPALEVPGVVAAISGAEIGKNLVGRKVKDYPLLARDRVLYMGQRIATVAAEDRETARRAAELVEVDYEPLPPVRDAIAALADGALVIHPDYRSYQGAVPDRPHQNTQGQQDRSTGDYHAGFDESDEVFETAYRVSRIHSAALEPHACLVVPAGDVVHVYSTHKAPYDLRRDLAQLSGRPEEHFTIHPTPIGGDFGSKGVGLIEVACYFLAMAAGRPVRCVMSYYEVLTATGARHPTEIRLRTGLRGARMHAHRTDVLLDGGAYAALKAHPLAVVPVIGAPVELYEVANVYERCETVYTNSLPGAHVRSPGEFQAAFAGESHVDQLARSQGMDPIQFRLKNTSAPALHQVLERLQVKVDRWRSEIEDEADTGIGIAVCFRDVGPGSTTASCRADRDGSVEIRLATPDQGAGSYTLFRRLAATTLGISEDAISVRAAGTDQALADSGAGASRVSAVAGRATIRACEALVEELGGPPAEDAGPVEASGNGSRHWIATRLESLGRDEVRATGSWTIGFPLPEGSRSYAAIALEVKIDRDTGEFDIRRASIVADTGVVINPVAHRGQIEGGFIYGLSQATLEQLVVEDGQVVTASLGDYRILSAADIPPLEVEVIEYAENPFSGMRSVGELANVSAAPALANAIEDAIGVRISELPINSERIRQACLAAESRLTSAS